MKKTLIIGASSGIGKDLLNKQIQIGNQVYASYNRNEINFDHENLTKFKLDILNYNFDSNLITEKLDSLVYCPGTIKLKPFTSIKEEDFIEEFNINVMGFVKVFKSVVNLMKNSTSASVVGFSSVCAKRGFNYHSSIATSKSALEGLFLSLAKEYAPKIRFNIISPSIVNTPLSSHLLNHEKKIENIKSTHPLQKIGKPHDISSMANFLISNDAEWMTGTNLSIDGGKANLT